MVVENFPLLINEIVKKTTMFKCREKVRIQTEMSVRTIFHEIQNPSDEDRDKKGIWEEEKSHIKGLTFWAKKLYG